MQGSAPRESTSPEVARLYLAEIEVVAQRREDRIDRRAVAWPSILTDAGLRAFAGHLHALREIIELGRRRMP